MSQDSCDDETNQPANPFTMVEAEGSQRTADISEDHKKPPKRSCWKRPTNWNVVFNGILALTTICLMVIAFKQCESSNLDQRAWVGPTSFIRPADGSKYFKEGSQPSFGVVITNTGKTPALKINVMMQRHTFPKDTPFKDTYNDTGGPSSTSVLFPGQTFNLTTMPEPNPLTARQVEMVTTGEFTLYVYGIITYEDVFETTHQTTFCGYLTTDLTRFQACSTYNHAT